MADGAVAEHLPQARGGFEDRQFAAGQGAVVAAAHAQRARIVEQSQQQGAAGRFSQTAVVFLQPGDAQQFGEHGLVLVGTLPQVDRRQVETEDLDGADQRRQP